MLKPEKVLHYAIGAILLIVIFSGFLFHFFHIDSMQLLDRTPLCIFRAITGKKCPGCGMTHAFLSIGKFQIKEAIGYNIFALPFFLFLVIFLFYPKAENIFKNKPFMYVLLILTILYGILRNINF
jgi:hypothetical protein